MNNAQEIFASVKQVLDKREISYEPLEGKTMLKTTFPLSGKLKSTNILVSCSENSFTIYSYITLNADEDSRVNVAEYINRANYGLWFGNFEMDVTDGEIRYRVTVDCEDRDFLSESLVMGTMALPMRMFEKYGDGFVKVIYGVQSPEDAINEAEAE